MVEVVVVVVDPGEPAAEVLVVVVVEAQVVGVVLQEVLEEVFFL